MKCLLLGGAGFIGSALAQRLVNEDHEITIVDNFSRGHRHRMTVPHGSRFVVADIAQWDPNVGQSWDWLFCLAGVVGVSNVERDPFHAWRTNTDVVQAALRIPTEKTFFASTSEVYGTPWEYPTPETAMAQVPDLHLPRAVYAASKLWGEVGFVHSGRPYVIGRFHNIYGPAMGTDHVIPKFCLQVKNGGSLIVDDPTAIRSFCYIDDAIEAIMRLMTDTANVIVNIGNPTEPITMSDLMIRVAQTAGLKRPAVTFGNRQGFPRRRIPDITRLTTLTGFTPKIALDEGVRRTWEWYAR